MDGNNLLTLIDIINTISPPPVFNTVEYSDLVEYSVNIIDTILHNTANFDPLFFSEPTFDEMIWDSIVNNVITYASFATNLSSEHFNTEVDNIVVDAFCYYYTMKQDDFNRGIIHPRSYAHSAILHTSVSNQQSMHNHLTILKNKPQPEQRTPEWYTFRYNLLTASSIWKALETGCTLNQLIYGKCEALNLNKYKSVSMNSPLHWGQKYEPISTMLYELLYSTTVEDFGCIKHDKIDFIGASPDGINTDPNSPRYGRMLEIKNIVNRDITGIPKKMYWIQMQVQMEVCGLDECDFFETRFIEYESREKFLEDTGGKYYLTHANKNKGVMLCLLDKTRLPIYEYAPLELSSTNELDNWVNKYKEIHEKKGHLYVKTIYWKLTEMSCVLVCRNQHWFNAAVPFFEQVWRTIELERVNGYAHRAPKRTKVKTDTIVTDGDDLLNMANGCLLCINKLDGSVSLKKDEDADKSTQKDTSTETITSTANETNKKIKLTVTNTITTTSTTSTSTKTSVKKKHSIPKLSLKV
jgi:putative phage-type endonuclease